MVNCRELLTKLGGILKKMGNFRRIVLTVCLVLVPLVSVNAQSREQEHDELRDLLKTLTEAVNSRDLDRARPLTHSQFTMITVDNEKFTSVDEFEAYWEGLFTGEDALLTKVELRPEADDLTEFVSENVGVVHGTSNDSFRFVDGKERVMKSRWTAVVQKEDGVWKLSRAHFSANLLDNPVLRAAQSFSYWLAGGGLIAGFLLGGLITYIVRRRST